MKKKIFLFLALFLFSLILIVSMSVKTYALIDDFNVLEVQSFDDFYSSTNGYSINGYVVGKYNINNHDGYFMDYYSTENNHHILITSDTFYNGNNLVYDDEFLANIYTLDIFQLVSSINNYLLNNTDYNTLLANNITYVINNYVDGIGYLYYNNAVNRIDGGLLDPTYENYYQHYLDNVGIINTLSIYGRFIEKLSYYIGVDYTYIINQLNEEHEEELEDARNEGYVDGFNSGASTDTLNGAFNDGYEKGYEKGKTDGVNTQKTFLSTIFGIFDSFINGISQMFNVEVFGINLSSIVVFIISISIIGFVLRRIF